jgi:hypothetical protein
MSPTSLYNSNSYTETRASDINDQSPQFKCPPGLLERIGVVVCGANIDLATFFRQADLQTP